MEEPDGGEVDELIGHWVIDKWVWMLVWLGWDVGTMFGIGQMG